MLNFASPTTAGLESGLGASLTLQGSTVTVESNLVLPSGAVTLHATTGNVLVNGTIDVSGTAQTFFDLTQYTNGGQVSLSADLGYVLLPRGSTINVSAQPEGGDAGTLTISAPTRFVFPGGTLLGQAGTGGLPGFSPTVDSWPAWGRLMPIWTPDPSRKLARSACELVMSCSMARQR